MTWPIVKVRMTTPIDPDMLMQEHILLVTFMYSLIQTKPRKARRVIITKLIQKDIVDLPVAYIGANPNAKQATAILSTISF